MSILKRLSNSFNHIWMKERKNKKKIISALNFKIWKYKVTSYSYLDKQWNKIIAVILLGRKFHHCLWHICHSCISIHMLKNISSLEKKKNHTRYYFFFTINKKIYVNGRKTYTSHRETIAFVSSKRIKHKLGKIK